MFDIEMFGMILVALGIVFGDDPLIGYGFIGVGGILAVVDIIKNLKKKQLFQLVYENNPLNLLV